MSDTRFGFATVEEAVEEIRQGRMIVLVDDEDRENEGDLTLAAEKITPEAINFMARFGRGLVCERNFVQFRITTKNAFRHLLLPCPLPPRRKRLLNDEPLPDS